MKQKKSFLLPLVSAFVIFATTACRNKSQEGGADVAETEVTVDLRQTITVDERPVTLTMKYPATLRGRQDIAVYPQVEGKIVKVCVEEGQTVKKGQPLSFRRLP